MCHSEIPREQSELQVQSLTEEQTILKKRLNSLRFALSRVVDRVIEAVELKLNAILDPEDYQTTEMDERVTGKRPGQRRS